MSAALVMIGKTHAISIKTQERQRSSQPYPLIENMPAALSKAKTNLISQMGFHDEVTGPRNPAIINS